MSIFSILKSRKLTPAWQYRTRGIIWRLFPAPNGLIVGEDRDEATRSVTFFCIDGTTGIPRWNDVRLQETWWISIEAVHRTMVFLHEFSRPDLPEHKKIIALDLDSGRPVWTNDELRFMFALDDCIYASKQMFERSMVYELDTATGTVVRELGDQPDYINVLRETAASRNTLDVEFPRPLTQGSEMPPDARILKHVASDRMQGEVEVIQNENHIVIGYYENTGHDPLRPELDQHLKILEKESGALVFSDVITNKARGLAPDMFFVRNDLLLFIKNGNTLKAIRLGSA